MHKKLNNRFFLNVILYIYNTSIVNLYIFIKHISLFPYVALHLFFCGAQLTSPWTALGARRRHSVSNIRQLNSHPHDPHRHWRRECICWRGPSRRGNKITEVIQRQIKQKWNNPDSWETIKIIGRTPHRFCTGREVSEHQECTKIVFSSKTFSLSEYILMNIIISRI